MAYKFLDSVGLAHVFDKIKALLAEKSDTSHTHNYAGSASVGGAANSANKLNTNAGNASTPVYFENGVPKACTSLNLEVNGTSESATKDGAGNVITDTYATKQETYTKTEVDAKVAGVVDSAPETLNTLNELAAALGEDPNFATTVSSQIGLKANTADLAKVATSGKYSDLSGTPTSLPANGGNAATVGGFTVGVSVPAGAKFTDTTYSTGNTTTAGITKLYTGTGSNTDGTMTQSAITTALNGKLSTSGNAASATKATQDGSGNVITSTYAKVADTYTKAQVDAKITDAVTNGQVDLSGYLTTTAASSTYAKKTELATALTTAEIDELLA